MKKKHTRFLPSLFLLLALLTSCGGRPSAPPPEGSSFAVHYIDVGQADAALVACDGRYMLIDGGNADDSDLIYAYLEAQGAEYLDYMVATHAHEDHIGGLSGALNYAAVGTALCPVTEHGTKVFGNMVKYLDRQGKTITVPSPGDTFSLGSANVEILGPVKDYDDTNNTSIVLRVDYGETSFLFTGDMERDGELDLIDSGAGLDADVLKVGHHGSSTSTSYVFLREVMPEYAVISVGRDNSYGHPSQEVLSRLGDEGAQVYRTDMQGTVIAESDGTQITFRTEKVSDLPVNPARPEARGYIGNSNTMKFHLPSCSSVPDILEQNKTVLTTQEKAAAQGYSPCQRCRP